MATNEDKTQLSVELRNKKHVSRFSWKNISRVVGLKSDCREKVRLEVKTTFLGIGIRKEIRLEIETKTRDKCLTWGVLVNPGKNRRHMFSFMVSKEVLIMKLRLKWRKEKK